MGIKTLGALIPKLSLPADEVNVDVLMHDPEMREAHKKDELNLTRFTLGWAKAGIATQQTVCQAKAKTLDMPLSYSCTQATTKLLIQNETKSFLRN